MSLEHVVQHITNQINGYWPARAGSWLADWLLPKRPFSRGHSQEAILKVRHDPRALATDITERPHTPSGVAAFVSADSKTPYVTPSMDFSSVKGVVRGRKGAAAVICLECLGECLSVSASYRIHITRFWPLSR